MSVMSGAKGRRSQNQSASRLSRVPPERERIMAAQHYPARLSQWKLVRIGLASALIVTGAVIAGPDADARITRVVIDIKESPTFSGFEWPGVGKYEKIVGRAFGEVDPF